MAHTLNANLFSLTRLQLRSSLAPLGREGSTYRELKAVLRLSDGAPPVGHHRSRVEILFAPSSMAETTRESPSATTGKLA